jgi:hypothetical protein
MVRSRFGEYVSSLEVYGMAAKEKSNRQNRVEK